MGTKAGRSSTVKAKTASKTSAPKLARARKIDTVLSHQEIAVRAYEFFCARNFEHGHDLEDWLRAEIELTEQRV